MDNTKNMKELLEKHGFKFSKSMGQNFLIDANIPEKIVRLSGISKSDAVLEVGPGIGALTRQLSLAAGRVTSVELDNRLLPILHDAFDKSSNVEIIHGDILKLDIAKLVSEKMQGYTPHVCANLPYNITTPVLTAFINTGVFASITVMIQREVAQRICAKPGTSEYGSFTVFANYHTEPEILFNVPPDCFMPRPSVQSSVVTMKVRKHRTLPPEDEAMFFRVVRAAFAQRRKTLANALNAVFGNYLQKEDLYDIIQGCGFDQKIRGETLSIENFSALSSSIAQRIQQC